MQMYSLSGQGNARRWVYSATVIALAATTLAACGSSGGGSAPPAAASSAAPSSAAGSASATAAKQIVLSSGHLVDGSGRTLYLWVADTGTKSTCSGACASAWPPLTGSVDAGTGVKASLITDVARPDGTKQVDYAGHPLYYFAGDSTAGATTGQGNDGFGAKWWEVSATGKAITTATSGAPASSAAGGYKYGG